MTSEGVRGALYDLERLGIASNDTALTAFVHTGVERASRRRFEEASALEQALIALLRETAPDMEKGDTWPLHLRLATQRLKDAGHTYALPELLRRIVRSLAADGRGEGGGGGSLSVRGRDAEVVQVTLQRDWQPLEKTAELRRAAARRLLDHLIDSLPPGSRGTDLLAETTLGKLLAAINSDLILKPRSQGPRQADGPRPAVAARAGGDSVEQGSGCVPPSHDHPPEGRKGAALRRLTLHPSSSITTNRYCRST